MPGRGGISRGVADVTSVINNDLGPEPAASQWSSWPPNAGTAGFCFASVASRNWGMSGPQNSGRGNATPAALQGHFSLKSSPFNAVSGKLTTQSLVVDHMNAHYRKLVKAKPAIDTGVPVSYLRSQKVRDRQRRDSLMRGDAPPSSSTPRHSSRPASARSYDDSRRGSAVPPPGDDYFFEAREHGPPHDDDADGSLAAAAAEEREQRRRLAEYARALAAGSPSAAGNQTAVSQYGGGGDNSAAESWWLPPHSARSAGAASRDSTRSASRGQQLALAKDTLLRRGMSADILDKRHHKFTEPTKSFTPRTLKKDVQSRLSSYKYYHRPQPSTAEPALSFGGGDSSGHLDTGDVDHDAADSVILDETLVSRDFERGSSIDHGTVPPLEMSLDTDHMKWLKEQSAERRMHSKPRPVDISPPRTGIEARNQMPVSAVGLTPVAPRAAPRRSVTAGSTQQEISRENEELMYLNFVTQVTNDILTRGIFSDRVLQQVFEEHVSRERDNLDESRMRALLDSLRDDLGITSPPPSISPKIGVDVGTYRSAVSVAQSKLALPHGSLDETDTSAGRRAFTSPTRAGRTSAAGNDVGRVAAADARPAVGKAEAAVNPSTRPGTEAERRGRDPGSGSIESIADHRVHAVVSSPAAAAAAAQPVAARQAPGGSSVGRDHREERSGGGSSESVVAAPAISPVDRDSKAFDGDATSAACGSPDLSLPGNVAIADQGSNTDEASDVELQQAHERSLAGDGTTSGRTKAAGYKGDSNDEIVSESDYEEYKSDEYDSFDDESQSAH